MFGCFASHHRSFVYETNDLWHIISPGGSGVNATNHSKYYSQPTQKQMLLVVELVSKFLSNPDLSIKKKKSTDSSGISFYDGKLQTTESLHQNPYVYVKVWSSFTVGPCHFVNVRSCQIPEAKQGLAWDRGIGIGDHERTQGRLCEWLEGLLAESV